MWEDTEIIIILCRSSAAQADGLWYRNAFDLPRFVALWGWCDAMVMVVFKNTFMQEKKNEELEIFDKFYANFSTTRVCRVFHIYRYGHRVSDQAWPTRQDERPLYAKCGKRFKASKNSQTVTTTKTNSEDVGRVSYRPENLKQSTSLVHWSSHVHPSVRILHYTGIC